MKVNRRLGVHTSIAGGITLSIERAVELDCNTMQIFSHNPRTWKMVDIDDESIERFKRLRVQYGISPVFIHSSYLINIASGNKPLVKKSRDLLIYELNMAERLGIEYVILHPGSTREDNRVGLKTVINILRDISRIKKWATGLLIENTAGEKGEIGSTIEEIGEIMSCTGGDLIKGICLDSCHAFQAGYDIRREKGIERLFDDIEKITGRNMIKLIHLNDSRRECNLHVDRHEHIGRGYIGSSGLKNLINHSAVKDVPIILETPKKSEYDDERNLMAVRRLLLD